MTVLRTNTPAQRLVRHFVATNDRRAPLRALWTLIVETPEEPEIGWPVRLSDLLGRAFHLRLAFCS